MPQANLETAAKCPPTVLFLDDSSEMLRFYQEYFGGNGYSVLTESHAEKAIQLAASRPLTVAVVDFDMPVMNGYEVCVVLKRIRPALPVIMVSGYDSVPLEVMRVVDFFLTKSASSRRLGDIIDLFVHH